MKNNYLIKITGLVALVFFTARSNAQLIDCNIFLQGNYLEIGINTNGAFGSSTYAPAGYHANVADTMFDCTWALNLVPELGFVADPDKDGWTVGTPPYYGDYILPGGKPREGWAISDSTGTATAYSSYYYYGISGFTGVLDGNNTAYLVSGTQKKGVWTGMFGGDSITVTQTTTIDTTTLYLSMHIGFSNTHSSVTDTFYYLRTVNAHNEATITSDLRTRNKVEFQLPNAYNKTVVSATGLSYTNAYMALGTADLRARGFLIRDSSLPVTGSLASIYEGDTVNYQYSDSLDGNLGFGLVFRIILGPGDSTDLDFGYSFKSGVIDSVLDTGSTGALITKNFVPTENISVYPNPTTDMLNITGLKAGEYVTISDILDRSVVQRVDYNGQQLCSIPVGSLPSGIYMMTVRYAGGQLVSATRLIKN